MKQEEVQEKLTEGDVLIVGSKKATQWVFIDSETVMHLEQVVHVDLSRLCRLGLRKAR
jgi:hypothetical protein